MQLSDRVKNHGERELTERQTAGRPALHLSELGAQC